jgi:hypothetical protein
MSGSEAQDFERRIDGIADNARSARELAISIYKRALALPDNQIDILTHGAKRIVERGGSALAGEKFHFARPTPPKYFSRIEPAEPGEEATGGFRASLFDAGFGEDPDRFGFSILISPDGSQARVEWTSAASDLNVGPGKPIREPSQLFADWLRKHRLVYPDNNRTPDSHYGVG